MNLKQAREIVSKYEKQTKDLKNKDPLSIPIDQWIPFLDYSRAIMFLDCYEQMEPLVEALEWVTNGHNWDREICRHEANKALSDFKKRFGE